MPVCNKRSTIPHAAAAQTHSRGFSLVEVVFVLAIFLVLSRITFLFIFNAQRNTRVSNALQTVVERTRLARQLAIDNRRIYIITYCFTPTCTLPTTPGTFTVPAGTVVIQSRAPGPVYATHSTVALPGDISFINVTGIPTNPAFTPDGFGQGSAPMQFDCTAGTCGGTPTNFIWFYPDGSAQDASTKFNNAVIYIARPSELLTSRAVTVWGATGRIKAWSLAMSGGTATWQ